MIRVKKALVIRTDQILNQIQEWTSNIQKYSVRLKTLREIKSNLLNQIILKGQASEHTDDWQSDAISESSTTSSNFSNMSKVSMRTKKCKQIEKKKSQIKEGSQYEDAALLVALKNLYKLVDSQQGTEEY